LRRRRIRRQDRAANRASKQRDILLRCANQHSLLNRGRPSVIEHEYRLRQHAGVRRRDGGDVEQLDGARQPGKLAGQGQALPGRPQRYR
jgi:hypothetical protein